ncbi:hypothetical protein BBJ28_00012234 [Nothophytophthora sp. Chile5]|nr:hypothetical protein BBJ28_00012234 [Nothophytophthora sp. Chile5]
MQSDGDRAEGHGGGDRAEGHGDGAEVLVVGVSVIPSTSCCYRQCKRTPKAIPEDAAVLVCSNAKCGKGIHRACFIRLAEAMGRSETVKQPICGKRCCNAVLKRLERAAVDTTSTKKRVPWHNDGPTPSISSLSCIIDWMTTGDNYSRFRGGLGQHGETKTTIAGEILRFIKEGGVTTARTSKDVLSKINSLEISYRSAADWLAATGSGVTDEMSLKAGILSRCSEYYQLYDVMHERPSIRPYLLNTDVHDSDSSNRSDAAIAASEDDDINSATEADEGINLPSLRAHRYSNSSHTSTSTTTSRNCNRKRPNSTPRTIAKQKKQTKGPSERCEDIDAAFTELKSIQLAQEKDQIEKLQLQQEQCGLQREELQLRQARVEDDAREAKARTEEAKARTIKLREEAETCVMERRIILLRERKKLLDEGVSKADIDQLLPLTSGF